MQSEMNMTKYEPNVAVYCGLVVPNIKAEKALEKGDYKVHHTTTKENKNKKKKRESLCRDGGDIPNKNRRRAWLLMLFQTPVSVLEVAVPTASTSDQ